MKKTIRLTESDLHDIIKKSVNRILKENSENSISTLANLLTGLDENTAESVASELNFAFNMGYDFNTTIQHLSDRLDPTPYSTSDEDAAAFYDKFDKSDIDDYAQERMELEAGYDDYPY